MKTHPSPRGKIRRALRAMFATCAMFTIGAVLCLAGGADAHNEGFRMFFSVELTGGQMVPAVNSPGKGVAGFTFNGHGDSLSVFGAATRLSGPITRLALHAGAPGASGDTFLDISLALKGNSFSGNLPISIPDLGRMMRGAFYLVIATDAHPDGEIRGQVKLARNTQFIARLDGGQAVPEVETLASGFGVFHLSPDDSALTVKAVFGRLEDSITSVHLGIGGEDDADMVTLDLTSHVTGGFLSARIPLDPGHHNAKRGATMHNEFVEALVAGEVYLSVRTKAHPAGEIRGTLTASDERVFVAELNGAKNVPAVSTEAKGLGLYLLSADDSTLEVHSAFSGLDSITAVHLHRGSKSTNADTLPGEPQFDLTSSMLDGYVTRSQKLSALSNPAAFLKDLHKGSVYFNAHTKDNPGGEIRGQLTVPIRLGTSALLEGAQETPAVETSAFGAVLATMDPDSSNVIYSIVADSLGSTFAGAHFHKAAVGITGPAVLDIGSRFAFGADSSTGLFASGSWWAGQAASPFTREQAKAWVAESLYVNIHSADHASGEIRGQIKDRIPDTRTVRIRSVAAAQATRLLLGAGGRTLRLQGRPGRTLGLEVIDMRGRAARRLVLTVGADGYSQAADLSALRAGLYLAAWRDGTSRRVARFVRP